MTAIAEPLDTEATGVRLYHSPLGLFDHQVYATVYGYERFENLVIYDGGIGKTHVAMATAAMLFEDKRIDICLLICEQNKLDEWEEDLKTFTDLDFAFYYGSIPKREKVRTNPPRVLISTFETVRNDAGKYVKVPKLRNPRLVPHVLTEALRGKRILIVYDEITKLGNRKSRLHKHHALMVQDLRDHGEVRVMGMTATPVERSPENLYNVGRIVVPERMPTVAEFEKDHIKKWDIFGNPVDFMNLPLLKERLGVILRKRKSDSDVIKFFPKQIEDFKYVEITGKQRDFQETCLDALEDLYKYPDSREGQHIFMTMRLIAGHPLALMYSDGEAAKTICKAVGEDGLRAIGSAKANLLIEKLNPLVKGQGAKVIVFTFFGQSILRVLAHELREAGFEIAVNHGLLTKAQKKKAKTHFKEGSAEIYLSSDAGSRGPNFPEATYIINYEMPLLYAWYTQRINRNHRIDSDKESVTALSFIAKGTVEEGIANTVLKRNDWQDATLGDDTDEEVGEAFLSAKDRKRLLAYARRAS